jgi:hypothetical protein
MRRRERRHKSRCQGAGFVWRLHRCDCEALRRGRTSPGRQKRPATRLNHSFRHQAPVPRPVAPAEVPTLVLPKMNSRGRYSGWYSPIGVNTPIRRQTWSVRPRIATPGIRVTVGDQTCVRSERDAGRFKRRAPRAPYKGRFGRQRGRPCPTSGPLRAANRLSLIIDRAKCGIRPRARRILRE